jgi:hypothetical protein
MPAKMTRIRQRHSNYHDVVFSPLGLLVKLIIIMYLITIGYYFIQLSDAVFWFLKGRGILANAGLQPWNR